MATKYQRRVQWVCSAPQYLRRPQLLDHGEDDVEAKEVAHTNAHHGGQGQGRGKGVTGGRARPKKRFSAEGRIVSYEPTQLRTSNASGGDSS